MRRVSAFLLATTAVMASVAPSYSQTENVLYDFDSAKTGFPDGNLLRERSGALVGTAGGYGYGAPYGQVFMLGKSGKSWNLEKLVGFNGQNGAKPIGGLIEVSPGIYYGTTAKGGAYGAGTVFQLVHSGGSWAETVLQSFQADADDRHPQGRLA